MVVRSLPPPSAAASRAGTGMKPSGPSRPGRERICRGVALKCFFLLTKDHTRNAQLPAGEHPSAGRRAPEASGYGTTLPGSGQAAPAAGTGIRGGSTLFADTYASRETMAHELRSEGGRG